MAERVSVSDDYDHYAGHKNSGFNLPKAVNENKIEKHGWLANQYPLNKWDREESIELFSRDLRWLLESSSILRAKFMSMQGAKIACTCPEHQDCHVDVIVDTINKL